MEKAKISNKRAIVLSGTGLLLSALWVLFMTYATDAMFDLMMVSILARLLYYLLAFIPLLVSFYALGAGMVASDLNPKLWKGKAVALITVFITGYIFVLSAALTLVNS